MGAKVESLGQVRDILPYVAHTSLLAEFTMNAAGFIENIDLALAKDLPFDSGPDRGVRVFLVLSNINVLMTTASLAATPGEFTAKLDWVDNDGNTIHLITLASDVLAHRTASNDAYILLSTPFTQARPSKIGTVRGECFLLNGTPRVIVSLRMNIGYYTEYGVSE